MNLPKIHSISKKIVVALLGGFLLVFLLFHMCANLCVLRNDDGAWYSAFCHFMGSNYVVKVFEVILLGCLALHILVTLYLWICNRKARPTRYHVRSRTKTARGSKIMVLTGVLMMICLVLHFADFFFVKFGLKNPVSQYMVQVEDLRDADALKLVNTASQYGMSPDDFVDFYRQQLSEFDASMTSEQRGMLEEELDRLEKGLVVARFMTAASDRVSADGKWIKRVSFDEKLSLEQSQADIKVEPDFYNMARNLFHNPMIVIMYLLFFAVVGFHIRHAFESVFQTFGLNNYKYSNAIEVLCVIYAWVICIGFSVIPIGVFFFL